MRTPNTRKWLVYFPFAIITTTKNHSTNKHMCNVLTEKPPVPFSFDCFSGFLVTKLTNQYATPCAASSRP